MSEHEVFVPITAYAPEWREGRNAERSGQKIAACPYTHLPQAKLWRAGWMAASRSACQRVHGGGPRNQTPPAAPSHPPTHEAPSPLVRAYQVSIRGQECPGCGGPKGSGTHFCEPCVAALPRGWWLVFWPLPDYSEARARYWKTACADLRGE